MLFKSIQVGRIENVELTDAGDVAIDAFINAPYHLRLTEGTRFWNASGFSIEIGAGGASLNVDSLISLLQGGVSFDTVGSSTAPIEAGHVYDLYPSESAARQNFFDDAPGERVLVDTLFEGSVGGLQPGAAVRFRGLQVGEVEALHAAIVDEAGRPQVTLRATLVDRAEPDRHPGRRARSRRGGARRARGAGARRGCAPGSRPAACSPSRCRSSSSRCRMRRPAALDRDGAAEPGDPERPGRPLQRRHLGRGRAPAGLRPAARGGGAERRRRCSATSTRSSPTSASARRPRTSARCSPTSGPCSTERHQAGAGRARALLASARGR